MNEISQLREFIRQKEALLEMLKSDFQGVQKSLDKSREKYLLLYLLRKFETKIGKDFDPVLSRKIDAVRFLLEG